MKIVMVLLCMFVVSIYATEYLYPVDTIQLDDHEYICVIHQYPSTIALQLPHLTMWLWDPETQQAHKGLSGMYTAANVTVLPDKQSFSFIYNDALRIKHTAVRSPLLVPFVGPYDISTIRWIDNITCYFSARYGEHFHIWHGSRTSDVLCLTSCFEDESDYLFPQKIDNALFCIKKTKTNEQSIIKIAYSNLLKEAQRGQKINTLCAACEQTVLYVHKDNQHNIGFLCMYSEENGYFMTIPELCEHNHEMYQSNLCIIKITDQKVIVDKVDTLYFFLLLIHPFDYQQNNPYVLYESLYPLLPRYYDDVLYYINVDNQKHAFYRYDMKCSRKIQLVQDIIYNMSPYKYKEKVYYGGEINQQSIGLRCEDDQYYIDLPYFTP